MYAATRKCSIHTKMAHEGVCDAKMMILRGLNANLRSLGIDGIPMDLDLGCGL